MFKLFTKLTELKFIYLIKNSTEHSRISILLSIMFIVIATKTVFSFNVSNNIISLYSFYIIGTMSLVSIYYFNYKFVRFMLLQDKKHYIDKIIEDKLVVLDKRELDFFYHMEIYDLKITEEMDIYNLKIHDIIQDSNKYADDIIITDYINYIIDKTNKTMLDKKIILQLNLKNEKRERAHSIIRNC